MRILFVCTGNTCRSPMAEKIFRKMAKEQGLPVDIRSAGTFAYAGSPASVNASQVLQSKGIQEEHVSQMVTPDLMDWATLVLTMTYAHKSSLLQAYPQMGEKIYTLKEYTNPGSPYGVDIGDPFGGPLHVYESCAQEIEQSLGMLLQILQSREDEPS